jgi:hypothetical protein
MSPRIAGKVALAWIVDRFRDGVENVAQSRHRQSGLVEVLPDLGKTQHRRADPPGQDIEGTGGVMFDAKGLRTRLTALSRCDS